MSAIETSDSSIPKPITLGALWMREKAADTRMVESYLDGLRLVNACSVQILGEYLLHFPKPFLFV